MAQKIIDIYTDGACRGNPGPGGWGALLIYGDTEKELSGYETHTTNNRMEMTAVIKALFEIKRQCLVRVTTDSKYLYDGVTAWLPQWKRNNWKTAGKKPVKNEDLWKQLDVLAGRYDIDWHWVKGHSGHPQNERADQLANIAIDSMLEATSRPE